MRKWVNTLLGIFASDKFFKKGKNLFLKYPFDQMLLWVNEYFNFFLIFQIE